MAWTANLSQERWPELTRCLVLAGRSFIGRHIVERLRRSGFEVMFTSRRSAPGVFRCCDLLNQPDVDDLIAETQPDWVLSLAGIPRHDPVGATRLHVDGTRHLLNAVERRCPAARIVLMGSAAEYGRVPASHLPIQEDCPSGTGSGFGALKFAQTQLAQDFAERRGLDVVSLRPFNVVGPGQPEHYLAGSLINRLRARKGGGGTEPITVANGNSTRDFVDVRDVADAAVAIVRLLPHQSGRLRVFNVCTGRETSVRQLAQYLCDLAGGCDLIDPEVSSSGLEIDRSSGDPKKLEHAVGWRPMISWQQSLDDAWYEANFVLQSTTCQRPAA